MQPRQQFPPTFRRWLAFGRSALGVPGGEPWTSATCRFALILGPFLLLPLSIIPGRGVGPAKLDQPDLVVPRVSTRFASLFTPLEYRYTGGVYEDAIFAYRLFSPEIEPGQRYPIVVWLHGYGEAGSDSEMHLAWLGERMMLPPWNRERFPFFVLCVPCPIDNDTWNGAPVDTPIERRTGSDMISVTDAILADVLTKFPVDRKRILLSGVSSGGSGAWQYALRWPERFAAVAPLAGGRVGGDFQRLIDVPVWCFHSTHDTGTPVDGARRNVADVLAAGGQAWLTEIDTVSHDCWSSAFQDHALLDWMLAQRKGSPIVTEHRHWQQRVGTMLDGWSVSQLVGQGVVLALLVVGGFGLLKRVQLARMETLSRWMNTHDTGNVDDE